MSLMQLLTVGKSFTEITSAPNAYKMDERHTLPKFAPVGRPVSLAPPLMEPALIAALAKSEEPANLNFFATTMAAPVHREERPAAAPAAPVKPLQYFHGRGFLKKLFPLKSTADRLIQSEMTLGMVKVLRNDLNDDFELVPIRARPKAARPAPSHPAEEQGNRGRWLGWLTWGRLKVR